MSALEVLRQLKQARKDAAGQAKPVQEWGNAETINAIGVENLSRRDLKNHLEARDLDTSGFSLLYLLNNASIIFLIPGTRLEMIEKLRVSLNDEQLHKFAYKETLDAEFLIEVIMQPLCLHTFSSIFIS